jgi:hypothetical protein
MTKPTIEELLQAIQRLQYETNVSFVQMSADIAIVCAALRERLVGEQRKLPDDSHIKDPDPIF